MIKRPKYPFNHPAKAINILVSNRNSSNCCKFQDIPFTTVVVFRKEKVFKFFKSMTNFHDDDLDRKFTEHDIAQQPKKNHSSTCNNLLRGFASLLTQYHLSSSSNPTRTLARTRVSGVIRHDVCSDLI